MALPRAVRLHHQLEPLHSQINCSGQWHTIERRNHSCDKSGADRNISNHVREHLDRNTDECGTYRYAAITNEWKLHYCRNGQQRAHWDTIGQFSLYANE